jgi:phosphocarrier protein
MIESKVTIINKLGLHARAAAKLVTLASHFEATIQLQTACKKANGKSIMSVMMLAAGKGTEITLLIDGDDEKQALAALEILIKQRFDESE